MPSRRWWGEERSELGHDERGVVLGASQCGS